MGEELAREVRVRHCELLRGRIAVPGDKSISHRALMIGAVATGETVVHGLQEGADCMATWNCLAQMGVRMVRGNNEAVVIEGVGLRGLREPDNVVDCANSGTTMRILCGVLAGGETFSVLTGDDSLRARPMRRVIDPLALMGANIMARSDMYAPVAIRGCNLRGIEYHTPVASAQVKSALTMAALFAHGITRIEESLPSRDHTERMLEYMGVELDSHDCRIALRGGQEPLAREIEIPGDFSAAAFFLGAAAILPGSCVQVRGVGINPTRTGFLHALRRMGARVLIENKRTVSGEPRADVTAYGGDELKGIHVAADEVPGMIDEIPMLAVVSCFASGETCIAGASELRVKETDRIHVLAIELGKMGADLEERADGMIIRGVAHLRGATVNSWGDHRIAMALSIAALAATGSTVVQGAECAAISFPSFYGLLEELTIR